MSSKKDKTASDDAARIANVLRWGEKHVLLSLFVPSHTKKQQRLTDQTQWASAACDLCGELYGGSTAFTAVKGVFLTDEDLKLYDEPIVVQSFAERSDAENPDKQDQLLEFARRMGKETKQYAVAIVIDGYLHILKMSK